MRTQAFGFSKFTDANTRNIIERLNALENTVIGLPVGGGGSDYELPPASSTVLGGVKIGSNVSVTTEGVISVHAPVVLNPAAENGLYLSGQILSLFLAGAAQTGALSYVDWNTFNGKQAALYGTGFVKISGSTITYDNNTYLTTSSASSTYLPLIGGTLSGNLHINLDYAKVALGNLGSDGDVHVGSSGASSPSSGNQDYGFYSGHNAYRHTDGTWRHSRQETIGAVRFFGGGGGATGLSGFSWDYSANNGAGAISWTNLMTLSNVGLLTLIENNNTRLRVPKISNLDTPSGLTLGQWYLFIVE